MSAGRFSFQPGAPVPDGAPPSVRALAECVRAPSRLRRIEVHAALPSTQPVARDLVRLGEPLPFAVVALEQTAGRGRDERSFHCPPGGLWVSLVLPPPRGPQGMPLTLPLAMAAALAVERLAPVEVSLKWPNDLCVGDRKLAGLLVDVEGRAPIVGLGMNVTNRTAAAPAPISALMTSLADEGAGDACSPAEVLRAWLEQMGPMLDGGPPPPALASVDAMWARAALAGRRVRVRRRGGEAVEGVAVGLASSGALRVARDGGGEDVVLSGHVEEVR